LAFSFLLCCAGWLLSVSGPSVGAHWALLSAVLAGWLLVVSGPSVGGHRWGSPLLVAGAAGLVISGPSVGAHLAFSFRSLMVGCCRSQAHPSARIAMPSFRCHGLIARLAHTRPVPLTAFFSQVAPLLAGDLGPAHGCA
jgi:hypothetical protein